MIRGIDYIGVGIGGIIVNDKGQILLSKRGSKARNERNLWEFPGGSVEFGETLAQALKREMREEFGIEICVGELLDVVDHILPLEKQHWVSPTYLCKISIGVPSILEPEKCSEIGWFDIDKIPQELTVISQSNFRNYKKRINRGS